MSLFHVNIRIVNIQHTKTKTTEASHVSAIEKKMSHIKLQSLRTFQ